MSPAATQPPDDDIRPMVAQNRAPIALWQFGVVALACGALLFGALEARRQALTAPPVKPRQIDIYAGPSSGVGTLYIPPEVTPDDGPARRPTIPLPSVAAPPPPPQIVYVPQFVPQPAPDSAPAPTPPARSRSSNDPALVYDGTVSTVPAAGTAAATDGATGPSAAGIGTIASLPARAAALHNLSTTVQQGSVIAAVLESALDSTRPGLARAVVQSDVRSFDGSRVVIPRGSRLIGEYQADLRPGQNRALVLWTRLVRPDGVAIALASPAADTVGRVGVRGAVNSHFFERFGAALLQSSLDIGVNLASRAVSRDAPVIVALPGTVQGAAAPITQGSQVQPTLRVKPATSITVFVARDLDFSAVEAGR